MLKRIGVWSFKHKWWVVSGLVVALIVCAYTYWPRYDDSPVNTVDDTPTPKVEVSQPEEEYLGKTVTVGDIFTVKVPNGWRASISLDADFLAIMFARPNELSSLTYSTNTSPNIDSNGIPAWNGLTEHFFIIAPRAGSAFFNAADHQRVTSGEFIFNDETRGVRYYVVKDASEAARWGGLQKDSEWQGRTYVQSKAGQTVEAHLAVYPSNNIDVDFYEKVVRTITLN